MFHIQTTSTYEVLKFSPTAPIQVEQDFVLMFGEGVSDKFLERWPGTFKKKIIQQCRKLPNIGELEELLLAADPPLDRIDVEDDLGKLSVNILVLSVLDL